MGRRSLRSWLAGYQTRRRYRPRLEVLEDRVVPAFTITGISPNMVVHPGETLHITFSGSDPRPGSGPGVNLDFCDQITTAAGTPVPEPYANFFTVGGGTPAGGLDLAQIDGAGPPPPLGTYLFHLANNTPLGLIGAEFAVGVFFTVRVTNGPSATLAFPDKPADGAPGEPLKPLTVTVGNDPHGTENGKQLTLQLTDLAGTGTLGGTARDGTATATIANGKATFTGLTVSAPGQYAFQAALADGNATPVPSKPFLVTTTLTWTGAASTQWSSPDNWLEFAVPETGFTLDFPAGADRFATVDDLPTLQLAAIHIGAGGYDLSSSGAGSVALLSGLTQTGPGSVTYALPTALAGPVAVTVAGRLDVTAPLSETAPGVGQLDVTGGGTLVLEQASTYSGGTTLHGATIKLDTATSLGAGPLHLNAGAVLKNTAAGHALTLANPLVLDGKVTIDVGHGLAFNGTGAQPLAVQVAAASTLTVHATDPDAVDESILDSKLDGSDPVFHFLLGSQTALSGAGPLMIAGAPVELAGTVGTPIVSQTSLVLDGVLNAPVELRSASTQDPVIALIGTGAGLGGAGALQLHAGSRLVAVGNSPLYQGTITLNSGAALDLGSERLPFIVEPPAPGAQTLGTGALQLDGGALSNEANNTALTLTNPLTLGGTITINIGEGLRCNGTVTVAATGATLAVGATTSHTPPPPQLTGTARLLLAPAGGMSGGTLTLGSAAKPGSGLVEIAGAAQGPAVANALVVNGGTAALDGTFNGSLTVNRGATALFGFAAPVSGTGTVDVQSRLQAFRANSGFTGAITLERGEIDLAAAGAGLGTGALTINGGALNNLSGAVLSLANGTAASTAVTFGAFHEQAAQDVNVGAGLELDGTIHVAAAGTIIDVRGTAKHPAPGSADGRLLLKPQGGMSGGFLGIAVGFVEIAGSAQGPIGNALFSDNAAQLALDGNFTGSLSVNGSAVLLGYSAPLTGTGSITVKSSGTLTALTASPAFTGAVNLGPGGTLDLTAVADNALGTGTLTITGGKLLDASAQPVNVENTVALSGTLTSAVPHGTLRFNQLVLASGKSVVNLTGGELDLPFLNISNLPSNSTLTIQGTGTVSVSGRTIKGLKIVPPVKAK